MMQGVLVVAIIFGGLVLGLAIVGSTILMGIKMFRGDASRRSQRLQAEEARMIQEIYQGLSRMEKRVEALETIILEPPGKDRHMKKRMERLLHGGLHRSRDGAILGVCKGIAEYFDFSLFWTRAIAVALLLLTGFWPITGLYFLAALLMKPEPVLPIRDDEEQGVLRQLPGFPEGCR